MEKAQKLNLGLILTLTLLAGGEAYGNSARTLKNVNSCLNFRSKSTYHSRVLDCIEPGTKITYIQSASRGYSLVEINGRRGYLYNKYLKTVAAPTPTPPVPEQKPASIIRTPPPLVAQPTPTVDATAAILETEPSEQRPVLPPSNRPLPSLEKSEGHVALWGTSPEKSRWTKAAVETIRKYWSKFMKAGDLNSFCPGFKRASRFVQESCILNIVAGTTKYETYNFNPNDVSNEGPPLNYHSVGLLQLSHNRRAKECVQEGARSEKDLKNPILNLRCGIRIMASLTARYGSIGGRSGAGKYWSVLQYSKQHRNSHYASIKNLTEKAYNQAIAMDERSSRPVAQLADAEAAVR